MGVPTTGSFSMFGTGSNLTIAGAIQQTGVVAYDLTTFRELVSASVAGLFDPTYAGTITTPITDISSSLQFRNYPDYECAVVISGSYTTLPYLNLYDSTAAAGSGAGSSTTACSASIGWFLYASASSVNELTSSKIFSDNTGTLFAGNSLWYGVGEGGLGSDPEYAIRIDNSGNVIGTATCSVPVLLELEVYVDSLTNRQILLPIRNVTSQLNISWGDTQSTLTSNNFPTHTYPSTGTYTILVSGNATQLGFANETPDARWYRNIRKVTGWGSMFGWTTFKGLFKNCYDLISVPDYLPSSVTNIDELFYGTGQLSGFNQQSIQTWNVSNVTSMQWTFANAWAFNQSLNGWDVSNVTTMRGMFADTNPVGTVVFNQPLNNWDVSSVTDMVMMFYRNPVFDQNISNWCVTSIPTKPLDFDFQTNASWLTAEKPVWGTCPP